MDHKQRVRWSHTHAAIILEGALGEGWPYFNEGLEETDADHIRNIVFEMCKRLRNEGLTEDDLKQLGREHADEGNYLRMYRKQTTDGDPPFGAGGAPQGGD